MRQILITPRLKLGVTWKLHWHVSRLKAGVQWGEPRKGPGRRGGRGTRRGARKGLGEERVDASHVPALGLVTNLCPTLPPPWIAACKAPLSMGFPRQEYWSGLPFPSPGNLPDLGIEPRFLLNYRQILYWLSYEGSHWLNLASWRWDCCVICEGKWSKG